MVNDEYVTDVGALEQAQSPTTNCSTRIGAVPSSIWDWSNESHNRHHAEYVNRSQPDWNLFRHQYQHGHLKPNSKPYLISLLNLHLNLNSIFNLNSYVINKPAKH